MGIALTVENDDGETQTIAWEDVQAASDFILLKPQMIQQSTIATFKPQLNQFSKLKRRQRNRCAQPAANP